MSKYRISQYNHEMGSVVLSTLGGLVPLVVTFIIIHTFYGSLVENGYTLSKILQSLSPFIVLVLILSVPRILYSWYILSYKIVVIDGKIIETQAHNSQRILDVSNIEEIKWSYIGVAPFGFFNWILKKYRGSITEEASKLPDYVGAKNTFSWGPQFISSQFQNFPKYPVSPEIIKEIKILRPELRVQGIEIENINTVKQQRSLPTVILFVGFGFILLVLGIAHTVESGNFDIFNFFNICAAILIVTGVFYWKKR